MELVDPENNIKRIGNIRIHVLSFLPKRAVAGSNERFIQLLDLATGNGNRPKRKCDPTTISRDQ